MFKKRNLIFSACVLYLKCPKQGREGYHKSGNVFPGYLTQINSDDFFKFVL